MDLPNAFNLFFQPNTLQLVAGMKTSPKNCFYTDWFIFLAAFVL